MITENGKISPEEEEAGSNQSCGLSCFGASGREGMTWRGKHHIISCCILTFMIGSLDGRFLGV